jgi:hypothetical protein
MAKSKRKKAPLCPSAQADWSGSVVIGVVGGSAEEPRLTPLAKRLPVTDKLLALSHPVSPTEVFRFAAPCRQAACAHFAESKCQLARRVAEILPAVTPELPVCSVRENCRWWQQEGPRACARCPQVVTDNYNPSEQMREAAYKPAAVE